MTAIGDRDFFCEARWFSKGGAPDITSFLPCLLSESLQLLRELHFPVDFACWKAAGKAGNGDPAIPGHRNIHAG